MPSLHSLIIYHNLLSLEKAAPKIVSDLKNCLPPVLNEVPGTMC